MTGPDVTLTYPDAAEILDLLDHVGLDNSEIPIRENLRLKVLNARRAFPLEAAERAVDESGFPL